MYSIIVAGAFALPSTSPCCGIPANCFAITPASGRTVAVVVPPFESLPPSATTATTTAAITAISPSAPPSTSGEALRPPVLRVGGRGTACCRCRRACLPLVIAR
jgi:hypothetical protein